MLGNFGEREHSNVYGCPIKASKSWCCSVPWGWGVLFQLMGFGQCSLWEKRTKVTFWVRLLRPIQCTVVNSTSEYLVKIDVWCDCNSWSRKYQRGSSQLGRAACVYDCWFCKLELLKKSGNIHLEVLVRVLDPSLPWHSYQLSFENQVLSCYWALVETGHLRDGGLLTPCPISILGDELGPND